jgi:hypothetical protein
MTKWRNLYLAVIMAARKYQAKKCRQYGENQTKENINEKWRKAGVPIIMARLSAKRWQLAALALMAWGNKNAKRGKHRVNALAKMAA